MVCPVSDVIGPHYAPPARTGGTAVVLDDNRAVATALGMHFHSALISGSRSSSALTRSITVCIWQLESCHSSIVRVSFKRTCSDYDQFPRLSSLMKCPSPALPPNQTLTPRKQNLIELRRDSPLGGLSIVALHESAMAPSGHAPRMSSFGAKADRLAPRTE
jgi:hypothetical protein